MTALMDRMVQDRQWAVLGVSEDPGKFGTRIFRALQQAGYDVAGVNPKLSALDGVTVHPDLDSLPVTPHVVSVVVPPVAARGILESCVRLGIRNVWFQPGAEDPAAIHWGESQGLDIVWGGPCILVELGRS